MRYACIFLALLCAGVFINLYSADKKLVFKKEDIACSAKKAFLKEEEIVWETKVVEGKPIEYKKIVITTLGNGLQQIIEYDQNGAIISYRSIEPSSLKAEIK